MLHWLPESISTYGGDIDHVIRTIYWIVGAWFLLAEAIRSFGQRRTPYAMLSRGIAGVRGRSILITLPGSSRGVRESLAAIFPNVLHAFNMMAGGGH